MPLSTQDEAYAQLVGVPADGPKCADAGVGRVVPGHPETSLVHLKVQNPAPPGLCGDPMPPGGRLPLDARDIAQIDEWITRGAAND
jgi:hypothetical protein